MTGPALKPNVTLPVRATLPLYTDGLVQRRRSALDHRISRAAAVVRDGRACIRDDLAGAISSRFGPSGGY